MLGKTKMIACMLCILLVASFFVGCMKTGVDNPGDDYEVNDLPKDTVGSLKIAVPLGDEEEGVIESLADAFKGEYPNVEVEIDTMTKGTSEAMIDYLAAAKNDPDVMPDIFFCTSFDMQMLSGDGLLLNLEPLIRNSTEKGTFDVEDYYSSMWVLGKPDYEGDKQYMVPRSADRVVCHYNKYIFEQANVDMSLVHNGWTWNEFLQVCETLRNYYDQFTPEENRFTNEDGYIIDAYQDWEAVFNPMFLSMGAEYWDENGKFALNDENAQKTLDLMKYLVDEGYAAPSGKAANFDGGQGAMLFHSRSTKATLAKLEAAYEETDINAKDAYDVVTFPMIGDSGYIGAGAAGYAVYAGTPDRELSWEFLKFMLSKPGQNAMAESINTPPIRIDMADPNENAWGEGFEDYNMEAYVWEVNKNIPTKFTTAKLPRETNALIEALTKMINDYTSFDKSFETVTSAAATTINRLKPNPNWTYSE